jgi:hypothetical protein
MLTESWLSLVHDWHLQIWRLSGWSWYKTGTRFGITSGSYLAGVGTRLVLLIKEIFSCNNDKFWNVILNIRNSFYVFKIVKIGWELTLMCNLSWEASPSFPKYQLLHGPCFLIFVLNIHSNWNGQWLLSSSIMDEDLDCEGWKRNAVHE